VEKEKGRQNRKMLLGGNVYFNYVFRETRNLCNMNWRAMGGMGQIGLGSKARLCGATLRYY